VGRFQQAQVQERNGNNKLQNDNTQSARLLSVIYELEVINDPEVVTVLSTQTGGEGHSFPT
jgi:hypothetical protein